MNKLTKTAYVLGLVSTLTLGTAYGQLKFTFDENGGGGLPFTLGSDPSGGVTNGPVLIYTLPIGVLSGDLFINEQAPNSSQVSDIVRFWNPLGNPQQSQIIFYSDFSAVDPADSFADSGLPSSNLSNFVGGYTEVGPEGNNGVIYTAIPFNPGSDPTGAFSQIEYDIISDGSVPEPSSVSLVLVGAAALFGIRRFRQK
jgi:hypothetical protein